MNESGRQNEKRSRPGTGQGAWLKPWGRARRGVKAPERFLSRQSRVCRNDRLRSRKRIVSMARAAKLLQKSTIVNVYKASDKNEASRKITSKVERSGFNLGTMRNTPTRVSQDRKIETSKNLLFRSRLFPYTTFRPAAMSGPNQTPVDFRTSFTSRNAAERHFFRI